MWDKRAGFVIVGGQRESARRDVATSGSNGPCHRTRDWRCLRPCPALSRHTGHVGLLHRVRQNSARKRACRHGARPSRLTWRSCPGNPGQCHPHLAAALKPGTQPSRKYWFYLRERFLSLRVFEDQDAIIDTCCHAWNAVADDADHIKSLSCQPWIKKVISN